MVDLVVQAELLEGAGAVAPADHGEPLGRGHGLGHGLGPGGETGVLEHAHGPVPEHGGRRGDLVGKGGGRARADVQAHPAVGHVGPTWRTSPSGSLPAPKAPPGDRATMSVGSRMRLPLAATEASRRWHVPTWLSSSMEAPVLWPWAARNVKHMPPPTRRASTFSSNASITPSLSETLAPPSTATKGRSGSAQQAVQYRHLAGQDAPGGRGQEGGWADDGGVRPVGGAERIVHVEVLVFYQRSDEGRVVALLAGVVAQVFQQLDPAGVGAPGRQQLVEVLAHRGDRVLGVGLALGPAQVAAHGQFLGPLVEQPGQGVERQADAQVVGDHAPAERDVEIAADEDALARDGAKVFKLGKVHGPRRGR